MLKRKKDQASGAEVLFSRELLSMDGNSSNLFEWEIDRGRVYSRIYVSDSDMSIHYELVEPEMDQDLSKLYGEIRKRIVSLVTESSTAVKASAMDSIITSALEASSIEERGKRILYYYLIRDFLGYDVIDGLLKDPNIEDITCDGSEVPVYVYHSSYGYLPTNVRFKDEVQLNSFVRRLVQKTGKNVSISSPLADSVLPDGSRLQASLGRFVTTNGPSFTIRKFKQIPLSPVDLIANGTASPEIFAYLWILTEYGANIMITGGTATGKTTFLNSILLFAPPEKKIVSIEDTKEINLYHENWLSTVTRGGFGRSDLEAGAGEVDMFDLLVASLRHRPDYVVIGEVRGRETFTVFQAMSVGRYSYCTFHAEDVDSLVHRLESKPIEVPRTLISSLDAIVVLSSIESGGKNQRLVSSLSEINGLDQDTEEIIVNRLYKWDISSGDYDTSFFSYVLERIASRTGQDTEELEKELSTRAEILRELQKRGISRFDQLSSVVKRYHRDSDSVINEFLKPR